MCRLDNGKFGGRQNWIYTSRFRESSRVQELTVLNRSPNKLSHRCLLFWVHVFEDHTFLQSFLNLVTSTKTNRVEPLRNQGIANISNTTIVVLPNMRCLVAQ